MHIESPEPVFDSVMIYIAQCHTAVATFDTKYIHTGAFFDGTFICIAKCHCHTAIECISNNNNSNNNYYDHPDNNNISINLY
jgi:hypothetical protein